MCLVLGGIFLLLLEFKEVKKYFGERLVLSVEQWAVYTGDRIGIVGANGAGKTTLFRLAAEYWETVKLLQK